MRLYLGLIALFAASGASGFSQVNSPVTDRERLLGAWHLVAMEEPGSNGVLSQIKSRQGMLVYTRDGHVSVQVMFPQAEAELSNAYVRNGYEASFGSYTLDEQAHSVTHHIEGSLTRGLVGKDVALLYKLDGSRLLIRPARPDEHWSVTWEHD